MNYHPGRSIARTATALIVTTPILLCQGSHGSFQYGDWHGTMEVGTLRLRVVVHLVPLPEGGLSGTADSLDQSGMGLKLADITWRGGVLTFVIPQVGGSYQGRMDPATQKIVGTWTQGLVRSLTLSRGLLEAPRRPQEPRPPFPYICREVAFPSSCPGVRLAGTLTLPAGNGPFPAVVLVQGSGTLDRDETIFGHKPMLVLADHLTRQGIAVLRYDKRGIKGSTGNYDQALTIDFAEDAEAALGFLASEPGIDPSRLGLLGHSEGGIIVPMVAARSSLPTFLVLLASPAVTGEELTRAQSEALAKAAGATPNALELERRLWDRLITFVQQNPDAPAGTLREVLAEGLSPELRKAWDSLILYQAQRSSKPWFRSFLALDPRASLRRVKVPVLALFGEKDLQVLPSQNRPELEKALGEAGNSQVEVHTLPGLNHLFQPARTGGIAEYPTIETTLDPKVLDLVSEWIRKRKHS